MIKGWWMRHRAAILGSLLYWFARGLYATLRMEFAGLEQTKPRPGGKIYAVWHGRTLIGANFMRGKGAWAIISNSNDGNMQNRVFSSFGFNTIRGSTGRGGERALVESIRVLKKGAEMTLTPDGPRGPSQKVQKGIMVMAKKSGACLVPCGVSASGRWFAKSWDRYMIPKPFARAIIVFGPAMTIDKSIGDEELEKARLRLEEQMNAAQAEAERRMGHTS